jgi:hypothetical protein
MINNYKPAEIYTLEQMLERFAYIERDDLVQDLLKPWKIFRMREFVKSHKSSQTEVKGKTVETTKLWENSPVRKQTRFLNFVPEHDVVGKYYLVNGKQVFVEKYGNFHLACYQYDDGEWTLFYISFEAFKGNDPIIVDREKTGLPAFVQ